MQAKKIHSSSTKKHLAKQLALTSLLSVGVVGCAESQLGAQPMEQGYQNNQNSVQTNVDHQSSNANMTKAPEAKCSEGMCGAKDNTASCGASHKQANAGCGASQ